MYVRKVLIVNNNEFYNYIKTVTQLGFYQSDEKTGLWNSLNMLYFLKAIMIKSGNISILLIEINILTSHLIDWI